MQMSKRSNKTNEVVSFGMLVLMRRRCMGGDVCFLAAAVGVVSGSTRSVFCWRFCFLMRRGEQVLWDQNTSENLLLSPQVFLDRLL